MVASPIALDYSDGAIDLLFSERARKLRIPDRAQRLCRHVRM
jgi:hypothetical protein